MFWKKIKDIMKNNPIRHCSLYKNEGCAHVDGLLCDFPKCSMLKEYNLKQKNNE